jgi:very-short-patch-repair endonuclease
LKGEIDPLQFGRASWHGCTVPNLDLAVSVIARPQYGTFNHRQVIDAGGTDRQIAHRLETGEWIALDRGVYALASAPATWRRQVMAAVLSKNRAIATGSAAGVLHEISVPHSGSAKSALAVVRRRSDFTAIGRVRLGRLTAASVAETLFDLSRAMSPMNLEGSLDDCLARDAVTPDELRAVLDRIDGPRLKGTKAFLEALQGLSNSYVPTESELERMLFRAINDPRVPPVVRQAQLPWWPILPHRVDAVIQAWYLILEADGRTYHTKRKAFERDRQRDNLAVAHGYRVMRFTYRALSTDPGEVLRLVLGAGEHGSHF